MKLIKRYLVIVFVLGLSLGLVTAALAAADTAVGGAAQIENSSLGVADPQAAEQAVNPGFTVDLTRGRVWGLVSPGDVVTVSRTLGPAAYGASQADGAGFFWSALYDGSGNGQIVGIQGGETLDFYVNGTLVDSISPMTITGGIDVLADQVSGHIEGAGAGVPVTVTMGLWGGEPQPGAPSLATTTDAGGDFTVTFTNMDLVAENLAAVDYAAGGNYVRSYLYPDPRVFLVQQYSSIAGYAPRFQNVHATVYITYPTDIRWEGDTQATFPFGFYHFMGADITPSDVVEVTFEDSTSISSTLVNLGHLTFDTEFDQAAGLAPTGASVLLSMWQWQGSDLVYTETHAIPSFGAFQATFTADLQPRNWVDVIIADANGNQTQLLSGPPFIDAHMDPTNEYDCVEWRVNGPDLPVTITLQTEAGTFTRENQPTSDIGNIGGWGSCYMVWGDGWGPIDFTPGSTVTVQTPSWSGSLVLADLSWEADTANDAIVGNSPAGEIEATVRQWYNDQYPLNGSATRITTAASSFTAAFADFDVRDGGSAEVRYFDPVSGFATHSAYWDDSMRYFQADVPYGVEGWTPVMNEPITAWLYESDGATLLASTSQDNDGDPWRFWFDDFQGYSLEPGYWIKLTAPGYFVAAESTFSLGSPDLTTSLNFENSDNVTHLLVRNFSGSNGADLDTDDDGTLDSTPWDEIVDCVALIATEGSGDLVYCDDTVGPDGSFVPGQVFACQDGWHIGDFLPLGATDTPGAPNGCEMPADLSISEIRIDQDGADNDEYFELTGMAGTSLDDLTYLVIGDGTGASGVIEAVVDLSGQSIPGWNTGLQIPYLSVEVDPDADLIWGEAPKTQLLLSGGREESGFDRFVPVDGYALNTSEWGHDLQEGDYVGVHYQAVTGNRVRQEYFWPQVRMDVNYAHNWIELQTVPNQAVTVTLSGGYSVMGFSGNGGWFRSYDWPWDPEQPDIQVGDVVTAEAVGVQGMVDPIGQINIEPNFVTNIVSGTIEAPWFSPLTLTVSCEIWQENGIGFQVAGIDPDGGSYTCDFQAEGWDLQPNQTIAVRYLEPDGDTVINIYQSPWMRVNYGHDWVGGDYEAGHTFWITLTESDGSTVKATAEIDTRSGGGWQGDGFETAGEDWNPPYPDIAAGDWVYFQSDDGYTNLIRVGEISGTLDVDADSVGGPIFADWFTDTLDVECSVWVPYNVPGKNSSAAPDGSVPYFCQWDPGSEWDIQPGQDVAVMYVEPDLDRVINVFREASPDLRVEKWAEGSAQAMPGGPAIYTIRYANDGDAEATTFIISDTLPLSTTYAADTSGVAPTFGPGWVAWELGPLAPGEYGQFQLFLDHTANPGNWLHNVVDGAVEFDSNFDNNHAEADVEVIDEVPNLYVNKNPVPGDPAPGQTMLWEINYGNNHPAASGFVVLTDTLPLNTSVVNWYSENGYDAWDDSASTGDQLVLTAPSIPGNWGDRILLRLEIDAGVTPGTQLTNTVEIATAAEPVDLLGDNWQMRNDVWVTEPRWDGALWKDFNWGQLVPGGQIEYHLGYRNHGNMTTHFILTDTLPAGTTYEDAWLSVEQGSIQFPPNEIGNGVVVWDLGDLEPGEWHDLSLILNIAPEVAPGTEIVNCADISIDGPDSWPSDNHKCLAETISEVGPNLRVIKEYGWNWYEQLSYSIRIENIGTEWLDNLWVTDTYPLSTTFNGDWWINHGPWITMTQDDPNNQLIFWLDELSPGETARVGFNADLDGSIIGQQGLAFTNQVDAPLAGDVNPADNHDEVTAYTGPDVYIEKWLSGGELRPGEIITFTVEFGNQNFWPWDGDPGYGSHITETLPAGTTFITATAPWNPDEIWYPEVIDGNTIVWNAGTMWNNSTWWFDVVVQLADTLEGGDVLVNRIEAFGDSPTDVEYNWENNVYELPLTILGPNLAVEKVYDTSRVAGTEVVYTLTVTNAGNEAATTVVLSDTLPANLTYTASDGTPAGGDLLWTFASVAPDGGLASGWFSGVLACTAGLTVDNAHYGVVSSDQGVVSDPGAPVSFTILAPTITVDFDQSDDTILEGELIDFTADAATDGSGLQYAWDFGDGGTSTAMNPSHTYTTAGVYDVSLTVTDGCGYSETITVEDAVTVERANFFIYLPLVMR